MLGFAVLVLMQVTEAATLEPPAMVEGAVRLQCTVAPGGAVRDCNLLDEIPAGRGFGPAALRMAPSIRVKASDRGGPTAGSRATVPVRFTMTAEEAAENRITPPGTPPLVENARWVRKPRAGDIARHYPETAKLRGVNGRANVLCVLDATGSLKACRALSESPAGYGFGAATAEVAERYVRLEPSTERGDPVAGRAVWFPTIWQLGR